MIAVVRIFFFTAVLLLFRWQIDFAPFTEQAFAGGCRLDCPKIQVFRILQNSNPFTIKLEFPWPEIQMLPDIQSSIFAYGFIH